MHKRAKVNSEVKYYSSLLNDLVEKSMVVDSGVKAFVDNKGFLHRADGEPALTTREICDTHVQYWFNHGKHHRIGGPATVAKNIKTGEVYQEMYAIKGIPYTAEGYKKKFDGVEASLHADYIELLEDDF